VADRLTWVGHATVLIELRGVRLLTDPFVRANPLHLRRHAPPADPRVGDALDAVLISHQHYDHLDLPSLKRLGRDVPIVVPRGAGALLSRNGFTDVREVVAGNSMAFGPVVVTAVRAEHDTHRRPGSPEAQPVGYLVSDGADDRIYFAGDTTIYQAMGWLTPAPVDVALLPIWGWGPKLGPGHMDPEEAARAAALLRPTTVVPIHWGTYFPHLIGRRRDVAFSQPPQRFADAMARRAPTVGVELLRPGESLALLDRATALSSARRR